MKINWPFSIAFLIGGIAIGLFISHRTPPAPPAQQNSEDGLSAIQKFGGADKPSGIVEALKIPFADPSLILSDRPARLQKAQWFFEKFSVPQLNELISQCHLPPDQGNDFARTSRVEIATNGLLFTPSDFFVRSLSPENRARINAVLAKSEANYPQQYPFRFTLGDFESRFDGSGLTPEKIQVIRSLTYTNGGDLCLADVAALQDLLSPDEFHRATDALYRFPVYRLRIRVKENSNVEEVIRYWGRGGREERIRPLLTSLAKVPRAEGSSISVSYLLPTFARLRLYTFPRIWNNETVEREDCFWSSMNFFNDEPDNGFLEPAYTRQVLQSQYHLIKDEPKLGDLVTLIDRDGNGLHMCVYLTDTFVFTKNEINTLSPWVIMKTADMLLLFPSQDGRKFVMYRRNDLS